jgi:hypothetical protein
VLRRQIHERGAGHLVIGPSDRAALAISVGGYAPEGAIFVGGLSAYLVARQRLLRIRADARGFSRAASLTAVIAGLVFIGDALVLVVSA